MEIVEHNWLKMKTYLFEENEVPFQVIVTFDEKKIGFAFFSQVKLGKNE